MLTHSVCGCMDVCSHVYSGCSMIAELFLGSVEGPFYAQRLVLSWAQPANRSAGNNYTGETSASRTTRLSREG